MAHAPINRATFEVQRAIKKRWLGPGLSPSLALLSVSVLFELPRVNVAVPCPEASPATLCVLQSMKITLVRLVTIKHPSPAIEDHFKFDVPDDTSSRP